MNRALLGPLVLLIAAALVPGHAQAAKKKTAPAPSAAAANEPSATQRLGTEGSWSAYSYREKAGRVCYLVGEPQKSEPASAKRKPATAMVTHRPDENVANVVSFVEGEPLKEGSDAALDIGGTKFDLFTKDDSAWSRTSETDKTIVETMAKGKQAVFKATPQKGPPTTDVYSLAGFKQALGLIDKACGIKR